MTVNSTYDALVEELPRLQKFARFLTGNSQAADDLVQDSVERAIIAIDSQSNSSSLRAWLFTIARNRHIDLVRRNLRRPDGMPINGEVHDLPQPGTPDDSIFSQDLRRAFGKLPTELRDVMWLVGIEGFAYAEAADVIGIPTGTIRSRMFRPRQILKTELKDYWTQIEVREDDSA